MWVKHLAAARDIVFGLIPPLRQICCRTIRRSKNAPQYDADIMPENGDIKDRKECHAKGCAHALR